MKSNGELRVLQTKAQGIKGQLKVPGDKSISHRSIMFGALAHGKTVIHDFLRADDCLATKSMFETLGVKIDDDGQVITVHGQGLEGLKAPNQAIDIGNSGTTIRLSLGLLSRANFTTTLFGDDSIAKRPMKRVMLPLQEMGATCFGTAGTEFPPITIEGTSHLHGITYHMPVASAQVKSAILLAALHAEGQTLIHEKELTRNHTEMMIRQFGGEINVQGKEISLRGPQKLSGQEVIVPGDISSAAFFLVAGLILENSEITLKNVGLNQTRTGIIDVIQAMGGQIAVDLTDSQNELGKITVSSSNLKGITIGGEIIPRLIDELPIIALLATQCQGQTIIKDAEELKVKETNRIDATACELKKLGAQVEITADGMIITGPTPLHQGEVTSYGDHRIGMMLAIAALLVNEGEVRLAQSEAVAVSYPNFYADLASLVKVGN